MNESGRKRMHFSRRGSPRGRGGGGFRSNPASSSSSAPPPFSFRRRNPPPPPPPLPPPPKSLPPPPRTRDDIFKEAGRLATEYLVSQGLLPPNLLSKSPPNISALARLGNGRQHLNLRVTAPSTSTDDMKPADTAGCSKAYQLPDVDEDNDYDNAAPTNKDEIPYPHPRDRQAYTASAHTDLKLTTMEIDSEVKDHQDFQKQTPPLDESNDNPLSTDIDDAHNLTKNGDLLRLCNNFAKVPTRTRSSITSKTDEKHNPSEAQDNPDQNPPKSILDFTFTTEAQNSVSIAAASEDVCKVSCVEHLVLPTIAPAADKGESASTQSLLDMPVLYEQGSGQGLSDLGRCHSMIKDRGDKRALQDEDMDMGEGYKKPKECSSTPVAFTDDYFHHNFNANTTHSLKSTASDTEVVEIVDQDRMFGISLLPRGALDTGTESKKEKQLFPSSFKICDLNLIESSDMAETHDSNPVYGIPSTAEAQKGLQVDVDLSISNSCNRSDDYDRTAGSSKESVIVEIDDDSAKEDDDFDTSERKTENAHSTLEQFPNSTDNSGDLPDTQDGYGLMISELLGNDLSTCSPVPADITGLSTDTGLQNGVEILDDDDPIYLSLGEIPISFLGVWEQPAQPFEKPF